MKKEDLKGRPDIKRLVDTFYQQVFKDELIGPIFTVHTQLDWDHHLPKMYDFWESVLFLPGKYDGNPMQAHLDLNERFPLKEEHFERWLKLFNRTVDDLFEGGIAERAKTRALSIATVIRIKLVKREQGL